MASWVCVISDILSVASISMADRKTNAENVLAILNGQLGWSFEAVCGVLGNMEAESYVNPGACESNRGIPRTGSIYYGGGIGLIQWTDLPAYTKENVHPLLWYADRVSGQWWDGTLQTNLINYADDYTITSCGTTQPRWGWISSAAHPLSFADYKAYTGTPEDAATYWLYNLERGDYGSEATRRVNARYWYNVLQGLTPDPPDPTPPTPPTPVPSRRGNNMPLWMMCRRPC